MRKSWIGACVQKSRATTVNSGARGDRWASSSGSLTRMRVKWLWSEGLMRRSARLVSRQGIPKRGLELLTLASLLACLLACTPHIITHERSTAIESKAANSANLTASCMPAFDMMRFAATELNVKHLVGRRPCHMHFGRCTFALTSVVAQWTLRSDGRA